MSQTLRTRRNATSERSLSWDNPNSLGWQLSRRMRSTGFVVGRVRRKSTELFARFRNDRSPLVDEVRRRYGLAQRSASRFSKLLFFSSRLPRGGVYAPPSNNLSSNSAPFQRVSRTIDLQGLDTFPSMLSKAAGKNDTEEPKRYQGGELLFGSDLTTLRRSEHGGTRFSATQTVRRDRFIARSPGTDLNRTYIRPQKLAQGPANSEGIVNRQLLSAPSMDSASSADSVPQRVIQRGASNAPGISSVTSKSQVLQRSIKPGPSIGGTFRPTFSLTTGDRVWRRRFMASPLSIGLNTQRATITNRPLEGNIPLLRLPLRSSSEFPSTRLRESRMTPKTVLRWALLPSDPVPLASAPLSDEPVHASFIHNVETGSGHGLGWPSHGPTGKVQGLTAEVVRPGTSIRQRHSADSGALSASAEPGAAPTGIDVPMLRYPHEAVSMIRRKSRTGSILEAENHGGDGAESVKRRASGSGLPSSGWIMRNALLGSTALPMIGSDSMRTKAPSALNFTRGGGLLGERTMSKRAITIDRSRELAVGRVLSRGKRSSCLDATTTAPALSRPYRYESPSPMHHGHPPLGREVTLSRAIVQPSAVRTGAEAWRDHSTDLRNVDARLPRSNILPAQSASSNAIPLHRQFSQPVTVRTQTKRRGTAATGFSYVIPATNSASEKSAIVESSTFDPSDGRNATRFVQQKSSAPIDRKPHDRPSQKMPTIRFMSSSESKGSHAGRISLFRNASSHPLVQKQPLQSIQWDSRDNPSQGLLATPSLLQRLPFHPVHAARSTNEARDAAMSKGLPGSSLNADARHSPTGRIGTRAGSVMLSLTRAARGEAGVVTHMFPQNLERQRAYRTSYLSGVTTTHMRGGREAEKPQTTFPVSTTDHFRAVQRIATNEGFGFSHLSAPTNVARQYARDGFSRTADVQPRSSAAFPDDAPLMPVSSSLRGYNTIRRQYDEQASSRLVGDSTGMPLAQPLNLQRARNETPTQSLGDTVISTIAQANAADTSPVTGDMVGQSPSNATETTRTEADDIQLDIEELTEKVWRKITRKLTVESERRGWVR